MTTTLQQAIYAEMDRQSAAGKRNTDLLDRMHVLLQRGMAVVVDERVTVAAGPYQGQAGAITSVDNPALYGVTLDSGVQILAPLADLQRDWIALASA